MNENDVFDLTPDPKVLIALTHTPLQPLDALCELIDNSIDSFTNAKNKGIIIENPTIDITLPKIEDLQKGEGFLSITDNGPGLDRDSAEKALKAGYSGNNPFDTLGLFGMGFNISTGKIGSITKFISCTEDNSKAIEIIIDLNKINESKNYKVGINYTDKKKVHGTYIEVYGWWPEGTANYGFVRTLVQYGQRKIRDELGRRYSTILRRENICIKVNSVECEPFEHCIWNDDRYVERQKHGKIPAVYRFNTVINVQKKCQHCSTTLQQSENVCPSCGSYEIRTIEERIEGWVGIQRFDDLSRFGIDLIRNGRAIKIAEKSAFFDFVNEFQESIHDYPIDSNYGRIVGEVHLNHVPVDFMKQDFQRSSPEWHRAMSYIRGDSSLQPTQPNADKNESPIYKLYQGYRKVKSAGKTDLYMGEWDPVKSAPARISRQIEAEFYEKFKAKEVGYYDDTEWYKKVEEADMPPVKPLPECPECGCQHLEEDEVCPACGVILKSKKCIKCDKLIPLSAISCPHCNANQQPEVVKPWICPICNSKNIPADSICTNCGSERTAENYLTFEYLLKNSVKDESLSITDCSITFDDNSISSPMQINVYSTKTAIHSNLDNIEIPVLTIKDNLSVMSIFVDKNHRIFKSCKIRLEQMIALEIAERIYHLNSSMHNNSLGKMTISFISWKIIEKYWSDKLEGNTVSLREDIDIFFQNVRERLILSGTEDLSLSYEDMTKDNLKEFTNNLINAGIELTTIENMRKDYSFIKYVPIAFIVSLFDRKPELFFDGAVWTEAYTNIKVPEEIIETQRERMKYLYSSCLNDILYYISYGEKNELIINRTQNSLNFLKLKAVE